MLEKARITRSITARLVFLFGRYLRSLRSLLHYPIWLLSGRRAPDNHFFKVARILSIAVQHECRTFVESGTFYGQTVSCVKKHFSKVISCELSKDLYELNVLSFSGHRRVEIKYGDSGELLGDILGSVHGRILFWLDGHYSGPGTALGVAVSPILGELKAILDAKRGDCCILIDDARLFVGEDGYPTVEEVRTKLREINPAYEIRRDHDCIVAIPRAAEF